MHQYTHYRLIDRADDTGCITPIGTAKRLGKSGIQGVAWQVVHDYVVSVEPSAVAGWGRYTAIGLVRRTVNGSDDGLPPALALLS